MAPTFAGLPNVHTADSRSPIRDIGLFLWGWNLNALQNYVIILIIHMAL